MADNAAAVKSLRQTKLTESSLLRLYREPCSFWEYSQVLPLSHHGCLSPDTFSSEPHKRAYNGPQGGIAISMGKTETETSYKLGGQSYSIAPIHKFTRLRRGDKGVHGSEIKLHMGDRTPSAPLQLQLTSKHERWDMTNHVYTIETTS